MKIGIILTGDYSWAGGLYYSLNIIKLLQQISLTKPIKIIVLVNNSTANELIEQIKLKNIEIVNFDNKPFLYKLFCKIIGTITNSNYRFVSDVNVLKLNVLYPLLEYNKAHKRLNCKAYYWLYDFQHKFLPNLFSKEEIDFRNANFGKITSYAEKIVVSSYDSKNHLIKFYPNTKATILVYNFVSLITEQKNTYKIAQNYPESYFIVCNQFWPHKNHLIVLKALKHLIAQKEIYHIIFTGKFDDKRNQKYVNEIKNYILENNLNSAVTFTGFISREDQIELMNNSKAVIQPSLFEGWSTVIEDAKALNKRLIVSDIPIHREQINSNVLFFNEDDDKKLAENIHAISQMKETIVESNYEDKIEKSKIALQTLFNIN